MQGPWIAVHITSGSYTDTPTWHAWIQEVSEEEIKVWLREQKSIIDFSFAGVKKPKDTLPLRAAANARIASAFGLTNSLTTSTPSVHRLFFRKVALHINRPDRSWKALFQIATATLTAELRRDTGWPLRIAEAARITSLSVVLYDNFDIAEPIPRDILRKITDEINDQWIVTKYSDSPPQSPRMLNLHLADCNLSHRFTNRTITDPDESGEILSIIMPQYETLWRVVLATYLLAFHIYPSPTLAARISSVPACLGSNSGEEKEALKLAKEGLRLTPSNKRIYRHTPGPLPTQIKADLELMHRHPSIWGPTALEFNPSRFDNLTPLQQEAYLPFSSRPHRCPAFSGFGDRMVTCLVVAMGRVLDTAPEKGRIHPINEQSDGPQQLPKTIDTGREGMESWLYIQSGREYKEWEERQEARRNYKLPWMKRKENSETGSRQVVMGRRRRVISGKRSDGMDSVIAAQWRIGGGSIE
ncbi:putative cytochrome P450 [Triangularia verruculosa]|uniref:Cytochrome P450 n=1 Tax=Triangularia verruculosa TaxID=2587418 RepID=A0AAN6XW43_9PEZI|nr:putative cytochrome P450 [Triangularia verruculosa]